MIDNITENKMIYVKELFNQLHSLHKMLWENLATFHKYNNFDLECDIKLRMKEQIYDNLVLFISNVKFYGSNCFACDLLNSLNITYCYDMFLYCDFCPINWKVNDKRCYCLSKNSLYDKYMKSSNVQECKDLAILIRDLPWDFNRVKKGLEYMEIYK